MSLETLVNGYKAVDQAVLKQYTRLGQHIPEEKLYKVTMGLNGIGWATAFGLSFTYTSAAVAPPLLLSCWFDAADFWLNVSAWEGKLPSQQATDSTVSIDPFTQFVLRDTRRARLPYFALGLGFLGMLCYDGIQDVIYDNFVSGMEYVRDSLGAISFLSLASSMYLKDQDPKLLQKKPSRVKAFFKGLYERAKTKVTPSPVPVPVAGYTVLEESVGTQ